MEKADAQVRAGLYPKDAQGKKTDKAFLGFLCDERVCGELLICVENQQFATHTLLRILSLLKTSSRAKDWAATWFNLEWERQREVCD
jgi:hypothetical protein